MSIREFIARTIKSVSAASKTGVGRLTGDRRLRDEGHIEKGKDTVERTADRVTEHFKV
ncbi:hypothetical protein O6072_21765 [Mycolicibacterium neoaurum]|uniref:hypothetical protein n=1 Tax=Mycolicibacterium neoaurum TaxID=1795 RepID=UPI00248CD715|nr:hypothetical protein [Mycolicibacterium neoaurum]WBP93646.1 hypothetical protein O7W24_21265 [Mycolicibacterium neoaurum]WBS07439.1 hypothetical protein O6072_21765 [Mycolicibacterium neoaurum]